MSPQANFATMVFTATPDAKEWAGAVRLKAWAMIDGNTGRTRSAWLPAAAPFIQNINTSVVSAGGLRGGAASSAFHALRLPTVEKVMRRRGSRLREQGDRRPIVEGFQGEGSPFPRGLNMPPGFALPTTVIPADKTEAALKFSVAANVPPGEYTVVLAWRCSGAVQSMIRSCCSSATLVRVSDPSTSLVVVVTAAVKK